VRSQRRIWYRHLLLELAMSRTMRWIAVALPLLVTCAPCLAAPQWDCPVGPNLVLNPGFEQVEEGKPSDWWTPGTYGTDSETARTGRLSLKCSSSDPESYLLCSQALDLEPGAMYEVRAYVRTTGLTGDDSGATVCVEWSDAEGKWLGGHYPEGTKEGAPGWHEVSGLFQVPSGAAKATVSCYLRKGMTGTAWWDDVSVRRWRQRPLNVLLTSPNYRGLIFDDGPSSVAARVEIEPAETQEGTARLVMRLISAVDEQIIAQQTLDEPGEGPLDLRLQVPDLEPGVRVERP
jgi:hypothetical protein